MRKEPSSVMPQLLTIVDAAVRLDPWNVGFLSPKDVSVDTNIEIGVKNPIMLARKIYDWSNRDLGMSRVPPNFLVGKGAQDFAWRHGVVLIPYEALITPVTSQRYKQWASEVRDYELANPTEEDARYWCRRPLTPVDKRIQRFKQRDLIEYPERHTDSGVITSDPEEELRSLNMRTSPAGGKGRPANSPTRPSRQKKVKLSSESTTCLLYTSDAADEMD